MKIKSGEVFTFYIKQKKQYGIIQVLEKGKAGGYNVRVFYHLFNDANEMTINAVVCTCDYYYIKNFYPADLVRTGKSAGCFIIPKSVCTPTIMRASERKANGALYWYVMNDTGVIETFREFNDRLIPLSPANTWGIQYIKLRWLDGFTLANWHLLEEKWYNEYLKTHEPHRFLKKEKELLLREWKKTGRLSTDAFEKLDFLLSDFTKQIFENKKNSLVVEQKTEELIENLNLWNIEYQFLETEESAALVEYICDVLKSYDCSYDIDMIDRSRQW